jgi:copper chaperone NosL
MKRFTWKSLLQVGAAACVAAAIFLPLWGMTLVSVQYPEGLRMHVYPMRITGDITEINMLNHYIGMAQISNAFFVELKVIPLLFAAIGVACLAAAFMRRVWMDALPLVMMAATALYGFVSMYRRLYQFGHDLDPKAAIDIAPFTPPMFGTNTLAQFATHSYFSWGTFLPLIGGVLAAVALWLDFRSGRAQRAPTPARAHTARRAHTAVPAAH